MPFYFAVGNFLLSLGLALCAGTLLTALLWPLFTLPLQLWHRLRRGPASGSFWLSFYLHRSPR